MYQEGTQGVGMSCSSKMRCLQRPASAVTLQRRQKTIKAKSSTKCYFRRFISSAFNCISKCRHHSQHDIDSFAHFHCPHHRRSRQQCALPNPTRHWSNYLVYQAVCCRSNAPTPEEYAANRRHFGSDNGRYFIEGIKWKSTRDHIGCDARLNVISSNIQSRREEPCGNSSVYHPDELYQR